MTYQERMMKLKGWQRFLLLTTTTVFINLVTGWVLDANALNGVYAVDGDYVEEPYFNTIFFSLQCTW